MTKPKPLPRDVPKILQIFRNFLLGRQHKSPLRFAEDISKRTQPLPNLPLGPSSKINDNYYCTRDARGIVRHPREVFNFETEKMKLLKDQKPKEQECPRPRNLDPTKENKSVCLVPGKVHDWDEIVD